MKLAAFLADKKISTSDFASRLGLTEVSVTRYVAGTRIPRPEHMRAITRETNGAVTANDFFDISPPVDAPQLSADPTDIPRPVPAARTSPTAADDPTLDQPAPPEFIANAAAYSSTVSRRIAESEGRRADRAVDALEKVKKAAGGVA